MSKKPISIVLAPLMIAIVASCTNPPTAEMILQNPKGEIIAEVGASRISREQIESNLSAFYGIESLRKNPKILLERQIERELLAQAAIKRGYLNDPDVQSEIKSILVRKMTKEHTDKLADVSQISVQEVETYYNSHLDEFNRPERIKAQFILVPFTFEPAKSLIRAEQLRKQVLQSNARTNFEAFKEVALRDVKLGEEQRKWETEFLTQDEATEQFGAEASKVLFDTNEENPISAIAKGKDGYIFFHRFRHVPALSRTVHEAEPLIRQNLSVQKRSEAFTNLLKQLKKEFKVTIYDESLASLENSSQTSQK